MQHTKNLNQKDTSDPVICIDGPTASGKGTLSSLVAKELGYHLLDSGALYRITALAASQRKIAIKIDNEEAISKMIPSLSISFKDDQVFLDGADVTSEIRTEVMGMDASTVSSFPLVRRALVDLQHSFRQAPGLVADGRDMGTVIFPDASIKIFLTAGAEQRALRRHAQLISRGVPCSLQELTETLRARDAQDSSRSVAPLKPADDAILVDNSKMSIQDSLDLVLSAWKEADQENQNPSLLECPN